MLIAGYVFAGLYVLVSILHLIVCFKENEKWRRITKPFCMLFLGIAAVLILPKYPLVYCGAFLGMIGDLLLIWKKKFIPFAVGTAAFLCGHFCYFAQLVLLLNNKIPFWIFIILGILPFLCIGLLFPLTSKIFGKKNCLIGNFYIPFLTVMIVMGVLLAIYYSPTYWPGVCIAVGYTIFLASDSLLVYTLFIRDIKRRDFYIMITYLAAELLIILGFILMFISR